MTKQTKFNIWYWIAAFFGVVVFQYFVVTAQQVAPIPYNDFEKYLTEGKITEVAVSDRFIPGTLKEPLSDGKKQFVTKWADPQFAE